MDERRVRDAGNPWASSQTARVAGRVALAMIALAFLSPLHVAGQASPEVHREVIGGDGSPEASPAA